MKYKGLNKCNVFTHLNHSDTFDTKIKTQNDSISWAPSATSPLDGTKSSTLTL